MAALIRRYRAMSQQAFFGSRLDASRPVVSGSFLLLADGASFLLLADGSSLLQLTTP